MDIEALKQQIEELNHELKILECREELKQLMNKGTTHDKDNNKQR